MPRVLMQTKICNIYVKMVLRINTKWTNALCLIAAKRKKSLSSSEWLDRKIKDNYTELAKTENYRCRSAFKLLEIDDRFRILTPGLCVVDLGAAPGSWTQVLVKRTNADGKDTRKPQGKVVSVDRQSIHPIEGATILSKTDFTLEASRSRVMEALNGGKVNLVVSDMAPNATGVKELDQGAILNLALAAIRFAVQTSAPGAACLVKIWDGGCRNVLEEQMKRFYGQFNHVRPKATQTESTEMFLLARYFKGLKTS